MTAVEPILNLLLVLVFTTRFIPFDNSINLSDDLCVFPKRLARFMANTVAECKTYLFSVTYDMTATFLDILTKNNNAQAHKIGKVNIATIFIFCVV
jgi:hypothetical protein